MLKSTKLICLFSLLALSSTAFATTPDTLRNIKLEQCKAALRKAVNSTEAAEATQATMLACPEIQLPSIDGPRSPFRYIEADCSHNLNIVPAYGLSGGNITGYTVSRIPYAPPFSFTAGTAIFIDQDDYWGDVINLPFPFCFFENTYNQAVVGANGLISFDVSNANSPSGYLLTDQPDIPSTSFQSTWRNAIYGVFEDIDPNKIASLGTGGSIHYGILGQAPCRTLTVSWYNVPCFGSCQTDPAYWDTYQTVLYEGTNIIDVYIHNKSLCMEWNDGRAIVGLQNATGTNGIAAPERNTTNHWSAQDEAWRFVPTGTPEYTITYYKGFGVNGQVLGTGENLVIDPYAVDSITVRLQYTACNGTAFDLRDSAVIVRPDREIVEYSDTIWYGERYEDEYFSETMPGTYNHDILDEYGCIVVRHTLHLYVRGLNKYNDETCENKPYDFYGTPLTEPGEYTHKIPQGGGHDSTVIVNLSVYPTFLIPEYASACEGDTYEWHDQLLTETGVYHDTMPSIHGCDSVRELHLTFHEKYLVPRYDTICDYASYTFAGRQLRATGIYHDSLLSHFQCDSVIELHLQVNPTVRDTLLDTICRGSSYRFGDRILTQAGVYQDTACNNLLQMGQIQRLELSYFPETFVDAAVISDVCADDQETFMSLQLHGKQPDKYSLTFSPAAREQGFENVQNVPYEPATPIRIAMPIVETGYVTPDRYTVKIEFTRLPCEGTTSHEATFIVRYPSWVLEQNWNDVVALLNADYNGNYVFSKYEWYVNGRKVNDATGSYLYLTDLRYGDEVTLYPTRVGDDYAIPTCPITIDYYPETGNGAPSIYPTYLSRTMPALHVASSLGGQCIVYNLMGEMISQSTYEANTDTQIMLNATPGTYLIYLMENNGKEYTNKIFIQ